MKRLFAVLLAFLTVGIESHSSPLQDSSNIVQTVELNEHRAPEEVSKILTTDTGMVVKLPDPKKGQTSVSATSSKVVEDGSIEFSGNVHVKISVEGGPVREIDCEHATISVEPEKAE